MTLDKLKAKPIYGNAHQDRELMDAIHNFVTDENNSYEERNEALMLLDKVMGFEKDSCDLIYDQPEVAVKDYIQETYGYDSYVGYFEKEIEPFL